MDENNIKANLKAANEYLQLLTNLQVEIGNAEQQINTTAKETESEITTVFSHLVTEITNSLINRRDELINNAQEVQRKGVLPLRQCQTIINNKIANTKSFINEGNDLLKSANKKGLVEFNRKSTLLGSLPEVPPLKEVPYISFHYDTNEESNLTNICRQFGDVIHISPVQITSLLERPGAILVEWAISENEDHFVDVQDYHLQWAFGTVNNLESNFHTCYIGPNLQYLVKDLNLNQNYSFRVRCKYEGDTQWSPWSLPQVCQTTIKSFSWVETDNFTLTNDNKIALSLLNTTSFVCSRRIEFNVGYSIEFTVRNCLSD
uniref:Fibronectin type-III domain-containing protein n=1 Tax=Photinus pyralis TaxID=7054 RepID=A0A1Y1M9A2_PHOPY